MMATVNRVIDELHSSLGLIDSDFFCECGYTSCKERIKLTRTEYGTLQADDRPVLVADHVHRRPGVVVQLHEVPVAARASYGSGDPRGR